jgi:beta-glucanase (GH16 family)
VVLLAGSLAYAVFTVLAGNPSQAGTMPPAPPGWTTVFQDNFAGSAGAAPSATNWLYVVGTGYGNREVEHTTRSTQNVFVDGDGHLVIKATRSAGRWKSGRIETTRDDFEAPPGGELEMTASIKLPSAAHALGYWPAFWALGSPIRTGSSWPAPGEIDMMEDINGLNAASQTLHDAAGATGHPPIACRISRCLAGYHTYSVIISRTHAQAQYLTFLIDGRVTEKITEAEVGATAWHKAIDHGFYIILNLAMGGNYPNTTCGCETPTAATTSGASMLVGYVAVYENAG